MEKQIHEGEHKKAKLALNTLLPLTIGGAVLGIIVGLFIWAYSTLAEYMVEWSNELYGMVKANLWYVPLVMVVMVLLALLTYVMLRYVSRQGAGCGIPYAEGQMKGMLHADGKKGIKLFFSTLVCSISSLFAGMPLDAEGTATKMGGVIGELSADALSRNGKTRSAGYERFMVTSAASAALAASSQAPLTGIMFSLEEGHRKFSSTIFISTISAVLFAVFTKRLMVIWTGWGESPLFLFGDKQFGMVPFSQIWMLIILGLVIGLASTAFGYLADKTNDFFRNKENTLLIRLISIFVIVGIVGLTLTDALFSGHSVIATLLDPDKTYTWQHALLLFCVRFILVVLAIDCKASGGLFFPMMALGGLLGFLMGQLFVMMGMDPQYVSTIVVISMTAFFASVVRAPLTGILLVVELTGQVMNGFFETGVVVFFAILITEIFNLDPIYDALLEDNYEIEKDGRDITFTTVKAEVQKGAFADGRHIRDILWPYGLTITKIERKDADISEEDNERQYINGEDVLNDGDTIYFNIRTYDIDEVHKELNALLNR